MAFSLDRSHEHFVPPRVEYQDGIVHHVISEGARFHTPSWDYSGEHCSEPQCEINHGGIRQFIECPTKEKL